MTLKLLEDAIQKLKIFCRKEECIGFLFTLAKLYKKLKNCRFAIGKKRRRRNDTSCAIFCLFLNRVTEIFKKENVFRGYKYLITQQVIPQTV